MSNSNVNKSRDTTLGVPYETALEVGARLKVAREQLGKDPSSVASRIKLREHYITAIEQGQWNELPPGLNGRGLVRIYAREMGVEVPELEPRQTMTSTHPQYEPTGQVSVISRQALMERELSRASQDIGRSVPRHNGGNLHSQGRVSNSLNAARPLARVPLPSPASSGLGLPTSGNKSRHLDARAQEIIQRNATATADRLRGVGGRSGGHEPRGESDDEAPLDVLTPDVASILGLTEQDLNPREGLRSEEVAVPKSPGIPEVSAESMAAEMFGGDSKAPRTAETLPTTPPLPMPLNQPTLPQPLAERRDDFEEPPETVPISRLFNEPPETRPTRADDSLPPAVGAFGGLPESGQPKSLDETPSSATPGTPVSSVAAMAAALRVTPTAAPLSQATAPTHSAMHGDWPQSGVTMDAVRAVSQGPTTARGLSGKTLLGYTGAALIAVGLGAFFFTPRGGEEALPENGALVSAPARDASSADQNQGADETHLNSGNSESSASGTLTEQGVTGAETSDASLGASGSLVTPLSGSSATESATQGSMAGTGTGVPASSEASAEASAPVVAPEGVAAVAGSEETSIVGTGSVTQAKLTLTESVEVQITTDGKRVHSGTKPPGVLTIDFTKSAEIFVSDGSKAKLTYGTWDHGALGHPGRKRRIFLNAQAFTPPAQ